MNDINVLIINVLNEKFSTEIVKNSWYFSLKKGPDPLIRRQMLYPAELRDLSGKK